MPVIPAYSSPERGQFSPFSKIGIVTFLQRASLPFAPRQYYPFPPLSLFLSNEGLFPLSPHGEESSPPPPLLTLPGLRARFVLARLDHLCIRRVC